MCSRFHCPNKHMFTLYIYDIQLAYPQNEKNNGQWWGKTNTYIIIYIYIYIHVSPWIITETYVLCISTCDFQDPLGHGHLLRHLIGGWAAAAYLEGARLKRRTWRSHRNMGKTMVDWWKEHEKMDEHMGHIWHKWAAMEDNLPVSWVEWI